MKINIDELKMLVSSMDLDKPCRKRKKVYQRAVFFHYLRPHMTLSDIGDIFNNNHATVIHGIKSFNRNLNYDDFKLIHLELLPKIEELFYYFGNVDLQKKEIIMLQQMELLIAKKLQDENIAN